MSPSRSTMSFLRPHDTFVHRHVGPDATEVAAMLESVGAASLDALVRETVPADILLDRPLELGSEPGTERGEHELIAALKRTAEKNRVLRSFIGTGYHGTIVPPVIQRNVLENPGWYTQYTPYQAEISQGRLEALLNFQTVVADLTGLPLAGASLLDEATAAAEAMAMSHRIARGKRRVFLVSEDCHPQTIAVVRTRADGLGIDVQVGDHTAFEFGADVFGVLLQYPASRGAVHDYAPTVEAAHAGGALVTVAADLLALVLLRPPGEFGADIAVGTTQRFGVPMGFGGPHAAYMSTTEAHKRQMPGRMIGLSKDAQGRPALRMAMQTREQHIRREKATSNICTAQVLLAVMAGMYAVYHGPDGLRAIAEKVHGCTLTPRGSRAVGPQLQLGRRVRHADRSGPRRERRARARGRGRHQPAPPRWQARRCEPRRDRRSGRPGDSLARDRRCE